jgi:hypothetical protein
MSNVELELYTDSAGGIGANEPHIDCNSFNVTFSYRKTIFIFISRF